MKSYKMLYRQIPEGEVKAKALQAFNNTMQNILTYKISFSCLYGNVNKYFDPPSFTQEVQNKSKTVENGIIERDLKSLRSGSKVAGYLFNFFIAREGEKSNHDDLFLIKFAFLYTIKATLLTFLVLIIEFSFN